MEAPSDASYRSALATRPAQRRAFAHQTLHERDAKGRDLAGIDGLPDGAVRLSIVAAVAKPAMPQQRADLDESFRDRFGIDVREAEHLEAGRVDDPAAALVRGEEIQLDCEVVCRPANRASEISAVFASASGATAFRIVDLPIPDWPMRTVR